MTARSLDACQETLIRIAASGRREANLFRTLTYGGEVPFLIDWAQSDVTRLKSHTPVGAWCATRKEWTCMSLKEICHSPVAGIAWLHKNQTVDSVWEVCTFGKIPSTGNPFDKKFTIFFHNVLRFSNKNIKASRLLRGRKLLG